MLKKIFTTPVSWIYGLVVFIRHKLFDWGVLPTEEFDIPVVCVGNLTVGGTGKTPHTEFLVEYLSRYYKVAVLSRGYKRKTRGFLLAATDSSFLKIGDEPKQIKMKFPDVPVAVCEKRADGIKRLRRIYPEIELIILDDAFQHRYVEPWVSILLMDYHRPVYKDKFLPLGRLRDTVKRMDKAQMVVVTKCPDDIKPIDMRVISKELQLYPYQSLYFSRFRQGGLVPLFPEHGEPFPRHGQNVLAMAAIANPSGFFGELSGKFRVVKTLVFRDHHTYKVRDLEKIKKTLSVCPEGTIVVMTEKDAVKFTNRKRIPVELQKKLYFAPIEVCFLDGGETGFLRQIREYVRKNQKYDILHPE